MLEQARRPPALVAMVVRLQHPLDARDPERPQAIEHGARPRNDDERGVAVRGHTRLGRLQVPAARRRCSGMRGEVS